MYERRTRSSFPLVYIVLAAAAVAALLIYVYKSTRPQEQELPPIRPEEKPIGLLQEMLPMGKERLN